MTLVESRIDADDPELVASTLALRDAIDELDDEVGILLSLDAVESHRRRHPYDGWVLDAVTDRLQRRLREFRAAAS